MIHTFKTKSGIVIHRKLVKLEDEVNVTQIVEHLNSTKGVYLSSGVEFPDRYSQWDYGIANPPLAIIGTNNIIEFNSLNARGEIILEIFSPILSISEYIEVISYDKKQLIMEIKQTKELFSEEERSLQPSLFTPLKSLLAEFKGISDNYLGLYGAFGFDLIYQFEKPKIPIKRKKASPDLHLFLPDEVYVYDRRKEVAYLYEYEFSNQNIDSSIVKKSVNKLKIYDSNKVNNISNSEKNKISTNIKDEEFEVMVDRARESIRKGDIFEVVLSRSFTSNYFNSPSSLFNSIRKVNPSPYEFMIQFGDNQLIGASPEMFVRVEGRRVESCPISGTVKRGLTAIEDEKNIKKLLNSEKDEVELTMCTDVDRNDKARVCVPGSVKLLARRMIERYAGLFHTVDHVEGILRENLTGLDAFLSHMWAVTLTGAPKKAAVAMVEKLEKNQRNWYGGSVGVLFFNGNINTGITIRTVHLEGNEATYRAGATLVWDSIGIDEAHETRTKAESFFRIVQPKSESNINSIKKELKSKLKVLLIDNEDSFTHILADYLRQGGANVSTFRHGISTDKIIESGAELIVHSPGPGVPNDFKVPKVIKEIAELNIPQFGVCLGLQGIVEAFGGTLKYLEEPRHGKQWEINHNKVGLFKNIESPCYVGAYHSIVADKLPKDLEVTATGPKNLIMAVRHKTLPIQGVQFHPESILTMDKKLGNKLIFNLLDWAK
ncbi:anthranilate synthase component I [Alphaproteobacteria bacterium]|nr:anthranilate synthase component I [Alphaproteobacteria bacterium]